LRSFEIQGDYATWFTDQPTPLLLSALTFVVAGLQEPALSLQASGALKQLCDANRTKLAPHIASFGEIHSAAAKISVSGWDGIVSTDFELMSNV